jgi:Fe-S cluster assembly protein SufD
MSQWFEQTCQHLSLKGDWLDPIRQNAINALETVKWPDRKSEDWRYLSLRDIDTIALSSDGNSSPSSVFDNKIENLNSIDLVFINGRLETSLDGLTLPAGLTIESVQSCSPELQEQVQHLGQIKPSRHIFGLINDASVEHGLIVHVAAEHTIVPPLRIIYAVTDQVEVHQRLYVQLEGGAKLTVIEQSSGDVKSLTNSTSEFLLKDNASLEHYRLGFQTGLAMQVGGCHYQLDEEAQLNANIVGFGSQLSRLDVDVIHAGSHANAVVNGVYLLKDAEVFDLHTTIEHAVPHGTTSETIRGIAANHAKAIFNGRIHIHRDAQKTLAELSNKNLLLARTAQINTKPELEIYADDVRCAHGATIAELDQEALYYLCSRGISKEKALVMMNFGFIQSVIEMMPNEALSKWLKQVLEQRFSELEY